LASFAWQNLELRDARKIDLDLAIEPSIVLSIPMTSLASTHKQEIRLP